MLSSETACFSGYAEEILEVQMAMPLMLFTDFTPQGIERPIVFGAILSISGTQFDTHLKTYK